MKMMTVAAAMIFGLATAAGAQVVSPAIPMPHAQIYPTVEASKAGIEAGLAKAKREHKRVILDFGGDWCGDCQVLNYYFHQSPNQELIAKYYVVVPVNIGHIDQNLDLGEKYGVVLKKGVPALSVVKADGTVVYAQKGGEFEDFRHNQPSDLTAFLEKWKPAK